MPVLVEDAAEAVASADVKAGAGPLPAIVTQRDLCSNWRANRAPNRNTRQSDGDLLPGLGAGGY
jgi:hypothetical protein